MSRKLKRQVKALRRHIVTLTMEVRALTEMTVRGTASLEALRRAQRVKK